MRQRTPSTIPVRRSGTGATGARHSGIAPVGWCIVVVGAIMLLGAGEVRAQNTPYHIKPDDVLLWSVEGGQGANIGLAWKGKVGADGMLNLGPYGNVHVVGMTMTEAKATIERQIAAARGGQPLPIIRAYSAENPPRLIRPTDVLVWQVTPATSHGGPPLSGRAEVDGNGMIDLGKYGRIKIAGMTSDQAKQAIEAQVLMHLSWEPKASSTGVPTTAAMAAMPTLQANARPPEPSPASRTFANVSATRSSSMNPVIPVSYQTAAADSRSTHFALAAMAAQTGQPPRPAEETGTLPPPKRDAGRDDYPLAPPPSGTPPAPAATPSTLPAPTEAPVERPPEGPMNPAAAPGAGCPLPTLAAAEREGRVPQELAKVALPPYVIGPPDILLIESTQGLRDQPIRGQHLVRPDGTVGLGIYGSVFVAGLTLEQARLAIAAEISNRVKDFDAQNLSVDVLAYNSKVYYVITDGGGYGEQVVRVPITGNETVLDAISQINGLPPVASKKHIWVARPVAGTDCGQFQVLPVDWKAITQAGIATTNYQVLPGDRIYVKADCWITFDSVVAKVLSPFERIVGFTLLTSETVNSIQNRNTNGGSGF